MDNSATHKKHQIGRICMVIGLFIATALLTAGGFFIASKFLNNNQPEGDQITSSNAPEEDQAIEEVPDGYTDVFIEGYEEFEDENGKRSGVKVVLTNEGMETTSIVVELAIKDEDGIILDSASFNAEDIGSGQTKEYYTFEDSILSPDQLKTADIVILKTYKMKSSTH